MFTRAQYLARECDHHTYYKQFVTPRTLNIVSARIGLRALRASTKESFNDIPLAYWDAMERSIRASVDDSVFKRLDCPQAPEGQLWWSLAAAVCIAKAAGRMLLDNEEV